MPDSAMSVISALRAESFTDHHAGMIVVDVDHHASSIGSSRSPVSGSVW